MVSQCIWTFKAPGPLTTWDRWLGGYRDMVLWPEFEMGTRWMSAFERRACM